MSAPIPLFEKAFGTKSELALVLAVVGILLVLFTPIPAIALDFLLILNFSIGLLVLLLTFYTDKPLAFSTFPSILLIATLFRLALNIAATRLILSDGYAGEVISSIGEYVVGGNYIIGLVVFSILIVVQFVVVTNGAQRVAEVAARFTLDSMPGKQMSIDADLNMGLIDEKEAKERRKLIEREANFYGAMDGASKFVKGDAIAGIIIILIDIIGGLTIGLAQVGLSWSEALHTYTLLTVGDGIVTQIPALVISTATGIIVTRAATDRLFGEELTDQVARYPRSLIVVAFALFGMLLMPGIPALPILTILALVLFAAFFAFKYGQADIEGEHTTEPAGTDDLYKDIEVDPVEMYVGADLAVMLGDENGLFMEKVQQFRKQYAQQMGFVFPPVKVKEDLSVQGNKYKVCIYGAKLDDGELYPDSVLAISPTEKRQPLDGVETRDPSYGLPAVWIGKNLHDEARRKNYTLVDPLTVIFTHFSEIIRNNVAELVTRGEAERVLARLRDVSPAMVEELIPNTMPLSNVQKVLQKLLSEKVSIRNITLIVESLIEHGKACQDVDELIEKVRSSLARTICEAYLDKDAKLSVLSLDPGLERALMMGLRKNESGTTLVVDPALLEEVITNISRQTEKMVSRNMRPVLLVSPNLRRHIRKLTARVVPHLVVLSLNEIPGSAHVASFSVVDAKSAMTNQKKLAGLTPQPA